MPDCWSGMFYTMGKHLLFPFICRNVHTAFHCSYSKKISNLFETCWCKNGAVVWHLHFQLNWQNFLKKPFMMLQLFLSLPSSSCNTILCVLSTEEQWSWVHNNFFVLGYNFFWVFSILIVMCLSLMMIGQILI